ncbi:MAG TPA: hypothetical protein VK639_06265 [Terriglobales bacterium]|nr:hypothetical protein [Terriglobales bacterium]
MISPTLHNILVNHLFLFVIASGLYDASAATVVLPIYEEGTVYRQDPIVFYESTTNVMRFGFEDTAFYNRTLREYVWFDLSGIPAGVALARAEVNFSAEIYSNPNGWMRKIEIRGMPYYYSTWTSTPIIDKFNTLKQGNELFTSDYVRGSIAY